jgi:IclR family acetate operon transcriptional repressor
VEANHANQHEIVSARRNSVQSVERAFDLVEALAGGEELGVTELAERTGLVPSTAHRLLATLAKRGYATRSASSGGYLLGYKVVELANGLENSLARLRGAAHPHLESIQQATGESANMTVLDGDRVVYVDQVEGSRSVRMFTTVGAAVLAHTTASGKAMLAHGQPEALTALYSEHGELERLTPRTLTTLGALRKDLERIARRGFAIDNEEHEEGVSCVAVPIFDQAGRPVAAISISGPTARIVHDTGELGNLLREHAAEISTDLGQGAGDGGRGDGARAGSGPTRKSG